MLHDAQSYKGKVDYVIVYDMSKMTRNMSSYYSAILPILDGCGIKAVDTRLPLEATPEANFKRAKHANCSIQQRKEVVSS